MQYGQTVSGLPIFILMSALLHKSDDETVSSLLAYFSAIFFGILKVQTMPP